MLRLTECEEVLSTVLLTRFKLKSDSRLDSRYGEDFVLYRHNWSNPFSSRSCGVVAEKAALEARQK